MSAKLRSLTRDLLATVCDAHDHNCKTITSVTYLADEYNIFIEMLTSSDAFAVR
jgi:hypothetical protein